LVNESKFNGCSADTAYDDCIGIAPCAGVAVVNPTDESRAAFRWVLPTLPNRSDGGSPDVEQADNEVHILPADLQHVVWMHAFR
jgi:hypothetical protein